MFEYDNGILVCSEHRTPAQKDSEGFWCRECEEEQNIVYENYPCQE